jgi:hypothetical protein
VILNVTGDTNHMLGQIVKFDDYFHASDFMTCKF